MVLLAMKSGWGDDELEEDLIPTMSAGIIIYAVSAIKPITI